jgi:hypothetical protein
MSDTTSCTTVWCDYLHTQFDAAHILSELGFTIVFDLVLLFLVWGKVIKPFLTRKLSKLHDDLDAEHHVEHHDHDEDET